MRPATPGLRTWTDATGAHRIEVAMVDFRDGKLSLKKEDGQVVVVPFERLSEADRTYLAAPHDTELAGGYEGEGRAFRYEDKRPLLGIGNGRREWGRRCQGRGNTVYLDYGYRGYRLS